MTFHNFDIFYKFRYIFNLSSALACRVESNKRSVLLEFLVRVFDFPEYESQQSLLTTVSISI